MRGVLSEVKANWKDPVWWKRTFRRRVVKDLYYGSLPNRGTYVMQEDWDNLFILDGCRFDLFEESFRAKEPAVGVLEHRRSRGTSTRQFIEENFIGEAFPDTVYVTANPFVSMHAEESFHRVIPVWDTGWSERHQTVPPERVTGPAIEAHRQHPDKRLIVHYIQPHYPFIGHEFPVDQQVSWKRTREQAREGESDARDTSIWNLLERGLVDRGEVLDAYRENLEGVLPHALELAEELGGKSAITSDHGNAIGEYCWPFPVRVYGHPRDIRIEGLVKVPWLELNSGARRKTRAADDGYEGAETETDAAELEERLRHLGYRS